MHFLRIHVYPTDCDMLGHVNHATMITFLEHARWAMLEPYMTVHDWFANGVWPVVRPDEWRRVIPPWQEEHDGGDDDHGPGGAA